MRRPLEDLLSRLDGVRQLDGKRWQALCPAHADHKPSLSIGEGKKGALLHCHAGCETSAVLQALGFDAKDLFWNTKSSAAGSDETVAEYDYVDEDGNLLFQIVRFHSKRFRQRRPDGCGGWTWNLRDVRRVPYRLPQVIEAISLGKTVYIVEGEKDVHALERHDLVATCNPGGAGQWRSPYSQIFRGAQVAIVPDNDGPGRDHGVSVAASLVDIAREVRIVELDGVPSKGDVSDWFERGGDAHRLEQLAAEAPLCGRDASAAHHDAKSDAISVEDFFGHMPSGRCLFVPTRELWPKRSVDSRIPRVELADGTSKASDVILSTRAIEQMTWAPGEPMLIEDRLIDQGGFVEHRGCKILNTYRPPTIELGNPDKAGPWLEHLALVFPDEAAHLILWFAHRVQRPGEKVNHALLLLGPQGTGKDTSIEGVTPAVGSWNVAEVSPHQVLGRFNGFIKSVILRVSEARDLGERARYQLYDHMKTLIASPPIALRVDEKNVPEYMVPNVCGVVITSNYMDAIYLSPDDRRHFVASTELTKEGFEEGYWRRLYKWYSREGGYGHVAAYLNEVDLGGFDPKAPPPQTSAFWKVVDLGRAPENAELAEVLDRMRWPEAVTLRELAAASPKTFGEWILDRRNSRQIPHRMEEAGYTRVESEGTKDRLWTVGGRRCAIYARRELSKRERVSAAHVLATAARSEAR